MARHRGFPDDAAHVGRNNLAGYLGGCGPEPRMIGLDCVWPKHRRGEVRFSGGYLITPRAESDVEEMAGIVLGMRDPSASLRCRPSWRRSVRLLCVLCLVWWVVWNKLLTSGPLKNPGKV